MKRPGTRIFLTGALILVFMVLSGCREAKTDAEGSTAVVNKPADRKSNRPEAQNYLEDVAIYESFSDIEPLFRYNNDTTYVVNFWATWCKPCIKELPYFEELNNSRSGEKVKVILVSLDFPKQVETNLLPFLEKRKISSEVVVLLDGKYNDWIDKVSPEWSGAIPATYVYRANRQQLIGQPFENFQQLDSIVKPFYTSKSL
ncbi:TlpA disulfide reductase family protein [Robiginitalea sp. IMCC43444]|uniref:TlpA disulfide reductase family protein n=1 Tax=Robiginitalea sp. IMCC43444 TaxID=3459121 RepID=UPI00404300F4